MYLAAVCRVWAVPLDAITKPRRAIADNTRSPCVKAVNQRGDARREESVRLYDFAAVVGIRRAEYVALRGDDLVRDKSGYLCVRVRRGKSGKY